MFIANFNQIIFFAWKFGLKCWLKYINTCILNLFFSKQLAINKCTLLVCTNTEIRMYCIYLQYTPSVRLTLHTLFLYRHTSPWRFRHLAIDLPLESCDVSWFRKFRNNRFSCFVHRYNLKSNSLVFTSSLAFEINTFIKWLIVFR